MSNRSGSPYSTPRDANRVPFLTAASTADGITPVVLEADPTTHLLQVSSSGGGGGTQYTDGSSTITHPIGTIPVYDKAGTITAVSVANPLPVSASITPPSDTTQTGSITGSGQSVTFAVNAQSTVGVQVSGTFSGTILIKGSVDGSTYTPTTATSLSTGGIVSTITSSFTGQVNVAGFVSFQLTSVSWTSGTANISLRASTGISNIMLDNPLPSGTNSIGNVGLNAGSNAIGSITNTSFIATQATGTNLHTVIDSGTVSSNNLQSSSSTATWTTATSINTALAQTTVGQGTVTVTTIETGTTTTAGALTFEVYDGTNWWSVQGQQTGNYTIQSSYTLVNNTNVAWTFDVAGFQQFRVRLSTAITGTGSPQVVILLQTQASTSLITPSVGVAQQLDQTNDSISAWIKGATYTRLTASGSVVSGTCVYYGYTVEASSSGTLIAYDNTAASGNTVGGTAAQPLGQGTVNFFPVPIVMTTGLYVTIAGTLTINFLTRSIGK